jgi:hypothetical protein
MPPSPIATLALESLVDSDVTLLVAVDRPVASPVAVVDSDVMLDSIAVDRVESEVIEELVAVDSHETWATVAPSVRADPSAMFWMRRRAVVLPMETTLAGAACAVPHAVPLGAAVTELEPSATESATGADDEVPSAIALSPHAWALYAAAML